MKNALAMFLLLVCTVESITVAQAKAGNPNAPGWKLTLSGRNANSQSGAVSITFFGSKAEGALVGISLDPKTDRGVQMEAAIFAGGCGGGLLQRPVAKLNPLFRGSSRTLIRGFASTNPWPVKSGSTFSVAVFSRGASRVSSCGEMRRP